MDRAAKTGGSRGRFDNDVVPSGVGGATRCAPRRGPRRERSRTERLGDTPPPGVVVELVHAAGVVGHRQPGGVETDALRSAPDDKH